MIKYDGTQGCRRVIAGIVRRHAGTYLGALKRDMTLPTTYWALMPVDTTPDRR